MKTPLYLLSSIFYLLLFGCQAFPTLTHPRTGFNYDWTPVVPYYPNFHQSCPEDYAGISRNDFIIAAEGGFQ